MVFLDFYINSWLQIPRNIASEKLASRTWEKIEEPFYSQDKATAKMSRCHNPKVLESGDISQMLCKLLKLHAAPDVDMEPFDGNTLNYHYFMALMIQGVDYQDLSSITQVLQRSSSTIVCNCHPMRDSKMQNTF